MVEDARADSVRRHRHCLELGGLGIARHVVEDAREIVADDPVGGEEGEVGVNLGGHGVIIAGADVAIGDQLAALAPHDQAQLGVGLELDEAVDHLDARAFQIARPFDVGFLVEAGLELDHRGHGLAGVGRLFQRLDDRRGLARAVERPFDRHDVGIGGGLLQELQHDVERFVRVMDDDVLLADGGEAIALMLADALGKAADERLELEVGPVGDDQLVGVGKSDQALLHEALALGHLQLLHDEALQPRRHGRVHFEPDDRAPAPPLERGLRTGARDLRPLLAPRCHCRGARGTRPGFSPGSPGTAATRRCRPPFPTG